MYNNSLSMYDGRSRDSIGMQKISRDPVYIPKKKLANKLFTV